MLLWALGSEHCYTSVQFHRAASRLPTPGLDIMFSRYEQSQFIHYNTTTHFDRWNIVLVLLEQFVAVRYTELNSQLFAFYAAFSLSLCLLSRWSLKSVMKDGDVEESTGDKPLSFYFCKTTEGHRQTLWRAEDSHDLWFITEVLLQDYCIRFHDCMCCRCGLHKVSTQLSKSSKDIRTAIWTVI